MPGPNQLLPLLPIETPRLKIRAYRLQDLEPSRPIDQGETVRRWIPSGILSNEKHATNVTQNSGGDARAFITEDRTTGTIVGEMTFHPYLGDRTWEIGWLFLEEYQGRGYATEAAQAILHRGFNAMGLHRIIATAQPQNTGSWRVMEKLGMRREGAFKQCLPRPDGTWWDEVYYAVLADEWHAANP